MIGRVTIQEVARAVGVSPATVSVVLNGRDRAMGIREATRAAVVEASDRLGYRPNQAARNLRRKHTSVLSLLVQDLANPCFVDIAVAARTAAEARGYEVNVVGAGAVDAELRALDRLRGDGSDGLWGASYGTQLGDMYAGPHSGQDGHFVCAMRIEAFEDTTHFKTRVDEAIRELHACRLAPGFDRLYAPGEKEFLT